MEGQTREPQPLPFQRGKDLTPFEHAVLIGSTAEFKGGRFGSNDFFEQVRVHSLDQDLFKLPGAAPPLSVELVNAIQERRGNQRELIGLFPFLDQQGSNLPVGHSVYLQPIGLIDIATGKVDPVWKVAVVDRDFNQVEDRQILNSVRLAKGYEELFDVGDLEPGAKILTFKE